MENLNAKPPPWNPLVLDALREREPSSMMELAETYGDLFAKIEKEWVLEKLKAAEEASPAGTIIPDQDKRHQVINSAILRQLRRHLYAEGTPTQLPIQLGTRLLNRTVKDQLNGKRNAIHQLHLNHPGSPPRSMALLETDPNKRDIFHVFKRGNPLSKGERVQPRFMTALNQRAPSNFPSKRQRYHLAQSIVSEENPLTRRVIVNWVWRHHLGHGLVRTPDDFGTRGARPTHPKLLDFLASTFSEDGWSIKKLHKRILLSRTYKQAAVENHTSRVMDPENHWLWRRPRKRLSLESMRDAMLKVSGELNLEMGGRPFDMMSEPITARRSVYGFVNRDVPSTLSTTFDGANPSACTAKRPETTVPQQTLFALNSTFIQDRAKAIMNLNSIQKAPTAEEKIRRLYQQTLSRLPEPMEIELAVNHVEAENPKSGMARWQQLAHALLASNEFIFVD